MKTPGVLSFLHMLTAVGALRLASSYDVFDLKGLGVPAAKALAIRAGIAGLQVWWSTPPAWAPKHTAISAADAPMHMQASRRGTSIACKEDTPYGKAKQSGAGTPALCMHTEAPGGRCKLMQPALPSPARQT